MEFVDVATAKNSPGLRGAFVAGAPSPWGEAAKGFFHIKQLPCVATRYLPGGDNAALVEWTGVDSGPAIVYENEPARSGWAEILLLAERLAPEPRLIPEDPAQRALMFGLAHEICGELGFGWSIRLVMVDRALDPAVEFPWTLAPPSISARSTAIGPASVPRSANGRLRSCGCCPSSSTLTQVAFCSATA